MRRGTRPCREARTRESCRFFSMCQEKSLSDEWLVGWTGGRGRVTALCQSRVTCQRGHVDSCALGTHLLQQVRRLRRRRRRPRRRAPERADAITRATWRMARCSPGPGPPRRRWGARGGRDTDTRDRDKRSQGGGVGGARRREAWASGHPGRDSVDTGERCAAAAGTALEPSGCPGGGAPFKKKSIHGRRRGAHAPIDLVPLLPYAGDAIAPHPHATSPSPYSHRQHLRGARSTPTFPSSAVPPFPTDRGDYPVRLFFFRRATSAASLGDRADDIL
jgi:hypothetical protein